MMRASPSVRGGGDVPCWRRGIRYDASWRVAALLFATWLLQPPSVSGTVIVPKSFADLAAEAELIFVGTVARVESRWADEERSAIETIVTFTDIEALLGAAEREVSLRFGGGEVDGLREQIAGVPRFEIGERVVLFARRDRSLSPIIGFHQGCFRVTEGPQGPAVSACATAANSPSDSVASLRLEAPDTGSSNGEPLVDFLGRVRREIERRPGGR